MLTIQVTGRQKDYEILARGSAFCVHTPNLGLPVILTSGHVAAPHRFPQYYPQDWLRYVQDKHCKVVFEIESPSNIPTPFPITQPLTAGFRHASLDIAAFVPKIETVETNLRTLTLTLLPDGNKVDVEDQVSIAGFSLVDDINSGPESVTPTRLEGTISELWPNRAFVDTGVAHSEMGMCGGPVTLASDHSVCVGLLEGLVPVKQLKNGDSDKDPHAHLQGKSVLIMATELRNFLLDVEKEIEIST